MDKDKKINLRKLFAEHTLFMIGIVICIAFMIFCAVMIFKISKSNPSGEHPIGTTIGKQGEELRIKN